MAAKRARGRPKVAAERQRKFRVQVAVNLAEYRQVRKAAEAADMSVSAWARARLMEAVKRRK
jgi:hypothetical protein